MKILPSHLVRLKLTYINVSSKHPTPSLDKQMSNAINVRINRLSYSKSILNNHKSFYDEAIHNSGYKNELKYLEAKRQRSNRDNNFGNNKN